MHASKKRVNLALEGITAKQQEDLDAFVQHVSGIKYLAQAGGREWDAARLVAIEASMGGEYAPARDRPNFVPEEELIQQDLMRAIVDAGRFDAWKEVKSAVLSAIGQKAVPYEATRDAILMASILLLEDLPFAGTERYRSLLRKDMEVWEQGLGTIGTVNGVRYDFGKGKSIKAE